MGPVSQGPLGSRPVSPSQRQVGTVMAQGCLLEPGCRLQCLSSSPGGTLAGGPGLPTVGHPMSLGRLTFPLAIIVVTPPGLPRCLWPATRVALAHTMPSLLRFGANALHSDSAGWGGGALRQGCRQKALPVVLGVSFWPGPSSEATPGNGRQVGLRSRPRL